MKYIVQRKAEGRKKAKQRSIIKALDKTGLRLEQRKKKKEKNKFYKLLKVRKIRFVECKFLYECWRSEGKGPPGMEVFFS